MLAIRWQKEDEIFVSEQLTLDAQMDSGVPCHDIQELIASICTSPGNFFLHLEVSPSPDRRCNCRLEREAISAERL